MLSNATLRAAQRRVLTERVPAYGAALVARQMTREFPANDRSDYGRMAHRLASQDRRAVTAIVNRQMPALPDGILFGEIVE